MRRFIVPGLVLLAIVTVATLATAQQAETAETQAASDKQAMIERGRYLTHDVAMCVICHSPKDHRGLPIREQQFEGGVIPAEPTIPGMQKWASHAPALSPLAGGHTEDMIQFLQTGEWPNNARPKPRPPMPPFRLSEEDARAVVMYLKNPVD